MSSTFSKTGVEIQLDNCTYCPKMCRHSCPVATATSREAHTPQAKMDRLNMLRRGQAPWTEESTDALWACTGCRLCTTYCEHGNEPGLVLFSGRARANARGASHPNLRNYPERFRNRLERLGKELEVLAESIPDSQGGTTGFLPGCDAIDKSGPSVLRSMQVFKAIGAPVTLAKDAPSCAGYPLLAAGYPEMFRWHAANVAKSLRRFEKVVVNCSACVYTMRSQYAAEGVELKPEIVSLAEFVAERTEAIASTVAKAASFVTPGLDNPLSPPSDRRPAKRVFYYHDPCYLARYSGVIAEPRKVLATVGEVREFSWNKTDTECCGGAGVLPKTNPQAADRMARDRLSEVISRGGGTVVTSCATCAFMLRRNAPDGVVVQDLSDALAEALDSSRHSDSEKL